MNGPRHRNHWRAVLAARMGIGDHVWHPVPSAYRTHCYSLWMARQIAGDFNPSAPRVSDLHRPSGLDRFRALPPYRTVHANALREQVAALLRFERKYLQPTH